LSHAWHHVKRSNGVKLNGTEVLKGDSASPPHNHKLCHPYHDAEWAEGTETRSATLPVPIDSNLLVAMGAWLLEREEHGTFTRSN
jgi:hypothetical protein